MARGSRLPVARGCADGPEPGSRAPRGFARSRESVAADRPRGGVCRDPKRFWRARVTAATRATMSKTPRGRLRPLCWAQAASARLGCVPYTQRYRFIPIRCSPTNRRSTIWFCTHGSLWSSNPPRCSWRCALVSGARRSTRTIRRVPLRHGRHVSFPLGASSERGRCLACRVRRQRLLEVEPGRARAPARPRWRRSGAAARAGVFRAGPVEARRKGEADLPAP